MTKDDIIRMAKETSETRVQAGLDAGTLPWLEHFANLVAAAERERCIGIIHGQCGSDNVAQRTVDAIRSQA
jgi:hypothetical protein